MWICYFVLEIIVTNYEYDGYDDWRATATLNLD